MYKNLPCESTFLICLTKPFLQTDDADKLKISHKKSPASGEALLLIFALLAQNFFYFLSDLRR
jgi:hypothetical protein